MQETDTILKCFPYYLDMTLIPKCPTCTKYIVRLHLNHIKPLVAGHLPPLHGQTSNAMSYVYQSYIYYVSYVNQVYILWRYKFSTAIDFYFGKKDDVSILMSNSGLEGFH